METVLIVGGYGLIGRHLSNFLFKKGYKVRILSRRKFQKPDYLTFIWEVNTNYIETAALVGVDYIINLAGANIGSKRWTRKRKDQILSSRVNSTKLLFQTIQQNNISLKGYISASAVGYYGAITADKIFTENDRPAKDFLGEVCYQWEKSATDFKNQGIRTVQIRTGVVLTPKGGALEKMLQPIKLGFGAVLGSGKQFMPWIHIADLCRIYELAIRNETINGAYNAVSPTTITNLDFTKVLANHLNKNIWLPAIPEFVLKILLGEMADLVLYGSRVSAAKIQNESFRFQYKTLPEAIDNLVT